MFTFICFFRDDFARFTEGVEFFHSHLNSINANIQFTVEMPTKTMGKNSMAFLDTNNPVNEDDKIEVVYTARPHIRASI